MTMTGKIEEPERAEHVDHWAAGRSASVPEGDRVMSPADEDLLGRIVARGEQGRGIHLDRTAANQMANQLSIWIGSGLTRVAANRVRLACQYGHGMRLSAAETRLMADASRTPRKPREAGLD